MAKNFASIYSTQTDAIALEQKIFVKEEINPGEMNPPQDADLVLANAGATINFTQSIESSPVRSDRHHTSPIAGKTVTEWTIPALVHIDTSLGVATDTQIDPGMRCLLKSLYGREQIGPLTYDSAVPPNKTFTLLSNGDQQAYQAPGSFVQTRDLNLPGDGNATTEFGGRSKTALLVGIGQSLVDNNGGNLIALENTDYKRFPVGSMVMLVEADGVTRSADTPNGSPRFVTASDVSGVTVSGAVLADADGTVGTGIYLVYYEPENPVAINDPVTGLEGNISISGFSAPCSCVRSLSLSQNNNHEVVDYCFGTDGLGCNLYVQGGRFDNNVEVVLNMNHALVEFMNDARNFDGFSITATLGDSAGRRMQLVIAKFTPDLPSIEIPETGSIPVTFSGLLYQSALDAADEVVESYL